MNYDDIMHLLYEEAIAQSEFDKTFDLFVDEKDKSKVIKLLIEKTGCDYNDARIVCDHFIDDVPLPSRLTPQQIAYVNAKETMYQQTRPKCPTCTSTNVEKISLTKKAIGGAMFGLFSSDVRKTMHCKNCGYKW